MKYCYYILLCFFLVACNGDSEDLHVLEPEQQPPASVSLMVTADNVPADSYSYAELTAIVKDRPAGDNQVTFTADKGIFANNENTYTVAAAQNDTIRAYLKYNKAEPVRVSASFFGVDTKEAYVIFLPSYPDQLQISPDTGVLAPLYTSQSLITTKLVKLNGKPSEGLHITYYDSIATPEGGSIGSFFNNTYSDDEGSATVKYWLQDTTYHGFVYIKGYINTPGGVKKGQNRILIE